MKTVVIDGAAVKDEASFHEVFRRALGFPAFYGCNFNVWIDCMSYLDDEEAGMSCVHVQPNELLLLSIRNADQFKQRSPGVWQAFLECAAFVNGRRVECAAPPLLVVSTDA